MCFSKNKQGVSICLIKEWREMRSEAKYQNSNALFQSAAVQALMNISVGSTGQILPMVCSSPENLRVQVQLTRLSGKVWEQVLLNQKVKHFPFLNQENNVCTKICRMNYPVTNTHECPETQLKTNHYEKNGVCCHLLDLMTTSNSRVIVVNAYFSVCLQTAHAFP